MIQASSRASVVGQHDEVDGGGRSLSWSRMNPYAEEAAPMISANAELSPRHPNEVLGAGATMSISPNVSARI